MSSAFLACKVPMTERLNGLLNPGLNDREPIFMKRLEPAEKGEKVYQLSQEQIDDIRALRGSVVDLHPGMGGIAPGKLIEMVKSGRKITSLDYMLTRTCNFSCTWCFAGSHPKAQEFIPFKMLESLTAEAAEIGVSLFVLTGGEPLMYRDPELGKMEGRGEHLFRVIEMIHAAYADKETTPKVLIFDDVALITQEIAEKFAKYKVGLCTKGDTLIADLQDYKVNKVGAFDRMMQGYEHLMNAGYGKEKELRVVVNSVLDHTTFDSMLDLHMWVVRNGFDHSIVPVHYCGNAEDEDQETGIHSTHVKVLYDLIARVDQHYFDLNWHPWSAFAYNKTCNRNRSGLHVRADGDVTACSESPNREETPDYTFGNVMDKRFSLTELANSEHLASYRVDFDKGHGIYVCSPEVCDLYENSLCQGGCAVRSAYSKLDYDTGLIVKNEDLSHYSNRREDPLCPAWTVLASRQGVLREGVLESIHNRILEKTEAVNRALFPFEMIE
ncbi:MAG: radical SAM protein [Gammaproteobacteria bacterium]|jgi:radical SAM protein with 4Fe4S-binding SPASM domain|nr:radical SAM protein [Gammaproteobacteria bacterium]MBT7915473.1 radical SAM protein [Candidatus Bathyarchaeota archaeon]